MAALVLVPAYTPGLPDDVHLTLVWPGQKPDVAVLSALSVIAQGFSRQHRAFVASTAGVAFFGEKRNEPVLLCQLTSELALMRAAVQQYSQSEHKEFRPHVAVPGLTPKLLNPTLRPKLLYFNQISLWPAEQGQDGAKNWWLGS